MNEQIRALIMKVSKANGYDEIVLHTVERTPEKMKPHSGVTLVLNTELDPKPYGKEILFNCKNPFHESGKVSKEAWDEMKPLNPFEHLEELAKYSIKPSQAAAEKEKIFPTKGTLYGENKELFKIKHVIEQETGHTQAAALRNSAYITQLEKRCETLEKHIMSIQKNQADFEASRGKLEMVCEYFKKFIDKYGTVIEVMDRDCRRIGIIGPNTESEPKPHWWITHPSTVEFNKDLPIDIPESSIFSEGDSIA